jgi:hypothetical protein
MSGDLHKLVVVREARLQVAQAALTRTHAALAAVDLELATLDGELQEIAQQRAVWENQWQSWLHEDCVLRHGQDYNLCHVNLSAWERDVREQRTEVEERRQAAEEEVRTARSAVLAAERRVELLKEELASEIRRRRSRHISLMESRAQEEISSRIAAGDQIHG